MSIENENGLNEEDNDDSACKNRGGGLPSLFRVSLRAQGCEFLIHARALGSAATVAGGCALRVALSVNEGADRLAPPSTIHAAFASSGPHACCGGYVKGYFAHVGDGGSVRTAVDLMSPRTDVAAPLSPAHCNHRPGASSRHARPPLGRARTARTEAHAHAGSMSCTSLWRCGARARARKMAHTASSRGMVGPADEARAVRIRAMVPLPEGRGAAGRGALRGGRARAATWGCGCRRRGRTVRSCTTPTPACTASSAPHRPAADTPPPPPPPRPGGAGAGAAAERARHARASRRSVRPSAAARAGLGCGADWRRGRGR